MTQKREEASGQPALTSRCAELVLHSCHAWTHIAGPGNLQVVIIPIVKKEEDRAPVMAAVAQLHASCKAAGFRIVVRGLEIHKHAALQLACGVVDLCVSPTCAPR